MVDYIDYHVFNRMLRIGSLTPLDNPPITGNINNAKIGENKNAGSWISSHEIYAESTHELEGYDWHIISNGRYERIPVGRTGKIRTVKGTIEFRIILRDKTFEEQIVIDTNVKESLNLKTQIWSASMPDTDYAINFCVKKIWETMTKLATRYDSMMRR